MIAGAVLIVLGAGGGSTPQAGWAVAGLPPWVKVDAAQKSVSFTVEASATGVNGTLNFNGYANGQMTVTVPAGWRVHIDFVNTGVGGLFHSLEVIQAIPASKLPAQGIAPAIANAESRELVPGIPPQRRDRFDFTAQPAGQYLWFCGVTTHGIQGMWDRFVVGASAKMPSVTVKR